MVAPMDMANARAPPDMGRRHRAANPEWGGNHGARCRPETRQAGDDPKLPRTAGGPEGEAAPSIRGADSVLAGTAVHTHRPKRGATVFHCHALDVPRRSLGPALQAVDFDSVRRCGHGQLLHGLASIQLCPTPLQRSRTLFCSIVALKAQVARQGGDTPGHSRFNCAGLSAGSPLTSVSRLSRSSAVTHQDVSGLHSVQQAVQARPLHHGPRDDVLLDIGGVEAGAGEPRIR